MRQAHRPSNNHGTKLTTGSSPGVAFASSSPARRGEGWGWKGKEVVRVRGEAMDVATSAGVRENHPRASAGCRCFYWRVASWWRGVRRSLLFRYRRDIGEPSERRTEGGILLPNNASFSKSFYMSYIFSSLLLNFKKNLYYIYIFFKYNIIWIFMKNKT